MIRLRKLFISSHRHGDIGAKPSTQWQRMTPNFAWTLQLYKKICSWENEIGAKGQEKAICIYLSFHKAQYIFLISTLI